MLLGDLLDVSTNSTITDIFKLSVIYADLKLPTVGNSLVEICFDEMKLPGLIIALGLILTLLPRTKGE